jgi:hypothetical protein
MRRIQEHSIRGDEILTETILLLHSYRRAEIERERRRRKSRETSCIANKLFLKEARRSKTHALVVNWHIPGQTVHQIPPTQNPPIGRPLPIHPQVISTAHKPPHPTRAPHDKDPAHTHTDYHTAHYKSAPSAQTPETRNWACASGSCWCCRL